MPEDLDDPIYTGKSPSNENPPSLSEVRHASSQGKYLGFLVTLFLEFAALGLGVDRCFMIFFLRNIYLINSPGQTEEKCKQNLN